jgi:hypothetical protein
MNVRYRIIIDSIMFKCDLTLRRATDKIDCSNCSDTGSVRYTASGPGLDYIILVQTGLSVVNTEMNLQVPHEASNFLMT